MRFICAGVICITENEEVDMMKSYQRQFKKLVEEEICKNEVLKYGRYKIYV